MGRPVEAQGGLPREPEPLWTTAHIQIEEGLEVSKTSLAWYREGRPEVFGALEERIETCKVREVEGGLALHLSSGYWFEGESVVFFLADEDQPVGAVTAYSWTDFGPPLTPPRDVRSGSLRVSRARLVSGEPLQGRFEVLLDGKRKLTGEFVEKAP